MTVKELGKCIYPGQMVSLILENRIVTFAYANELQKSYYKDSEVELGSIKIVEDVISIRVSKVIEPTD